MRKSPLDKIKVAAPCTSRWESMYGSEQVRFCGQCQLSVYNLSAMSRKEAEELLRNREGRVCVRFYRRKDGTILTRNCPIGLRAVKKRLSRFSTAVLTAALSFFTQVGLLWWMDKSGMKAEGVSALLNRWFPIAPEVMGATMITPADMRRAGKTVRESEEAVRSRATTKVKPVVKSLLPPEMIREEVVVDIFISRTGSVLFATCVYAPGDIQEAVENAAYGWKFKPLLENGEPVQVESTLTFRFGQ